MSDRLQRALARFRRSRADDGGGTWARISAAEFRAATEERLRSLEREVAEVKGDGLADLVVQFDRGINTGTDSIRIIE